MCVVLGVGVINVFDAVAFLACMYRVSSTLTLSSISIMSPPPTILTMLDEATGLIMCYHDGNAFRYIMVAFDEKIL